MRKILFNKWMFLAALLLISFSAFSFAVYKETRSLCAHKCAKSPAAVPDAGGLLWDAVSRQFTSVSVQ